MLLIILAAGAGVTGEAELAAVLSTVVRGLDDDAFGVRHQAQQDLVHLWGLLGQ